MDDFLLIEAIGKNDDEAFKALFKHYYEPLVGYITTFTNSSQVSEDIVQQTFITLWMKRHDFNIKESVKSYLYSTAYNKYIDDYRKLKRRDSFFDDLKEKALRDAISEDKELLDARIKKLKNIIESLPSRCKEILELNKLRGLKYSEIADKLAISQKTVDAQMRIAYKKIREGFEVIK